jgi:hypothetical protein
MRIRKQLFNAHFGYLTVEQVADVRLVVIKKHGKFGLGVSLLPDPLQQALRILALILSATVSVGEKFRTSKTSGSVIT